MSISTWSGPESNADETYPSALLQHLLKLMMVEFGAQGACIALYDESIGQMRIQAHLRLLNVKAPKYSASNANQPADGNKAAGRRVTIKLFQDAYTSGTNAGRKRTSAGTEEEFVEVTPKEYDLFTVGSTYPPGHDLIGFTWHKNEPLAMSHEDYVTFFHTSRSLSTQGDNAFHSYLALPIREVSSGHNVSSTQQPPTLLGVLVLYQTNTNGHSFQKLRGEAMERVKHIALYLQNDKLQRAQRRTSEYLQLLQGISNTFPSSVKLVDLVEHIYEFCTHVVDVSSILLTLYDRDLDRLYDVFALHDGVRVEGLVEHPRIMRKEERPVWWSVTQKEKRALHFSPAREAHWVIQYQELLTGIWGDQRQAESFLLLPMKMFNRVIGSLCLTSMRPHAYHLEEIQVLETMVQIVTVGIENAKLYERDRHILHEARQREAQLAAVNSTLQAISSVLNVTELLNNLVESVATLVKVDMCAFFQPSPTREKLVALALYGATHVRMVDDGSGMPVEEEDAKLVEHGELINRIQLPFKGTFLERMVDEGFFYLDTSNLEELAHGSNEGGAIFLRETNIRYMLMIPMSYQKEFSGFLAVPVPGESNTFRPKDVGTLLAICAQASSAIRNAQLFEQRTEAYAELERMNRLKDEFLVTASHELRTPLTAISGYSSQLKRQSARANPQQILRFATRISVAAQQLNDQVANMTEAAQIGAADRNMQIEPVHLRAAAEIAINMLTFSSEQNVTMDIASNLWLNGDPPRVRQILTNLLENAAKYSPPESPIQISSCVMPLSQIEHLLSEDQINHTLLLEQEDELMVLVRVKDQGEGILPTDKLKIFEKFVRAPRSLTTTVRGSGLGLYICRRFVEAMGGKLWLEHSIPNEGSVFSFYLPYIKAPVDVEE